MKTRTMKVSEAKSHFSELLEAAKNGEIIHIVKGNQTEPIATIQGYIAPRKKKIEFGGLAKNDPVEFADDWEMTVEEFLGYEDLT